MIHGTRAFVLIISLSLLAAAATFAVVIFLRSPAPQSGTLGAQNVNHLLSGISSEPAVTRVGAPPAHSLEEMLPQADSLQNPQTRREEGSVCSLTKLKAIAKTGSRVATRLTVAQGKATEITQKLQQIKVDTSASAREQLLSEKILRDAQQRMSGLKLELEVESTRVKEEQHMFTLIEGTCSIETDNDEKRDIMRPVAMMQREEVAFTHAYDGAVQVIVEVEELLSELNEDL
jgi:hypothetical protein